MTSGYGPGNCGSSPRMRGTAARPAPVRTLRRFIPAHAGNSRRYGVRGRFRPVHPRACGEQLSMEKMPPRAAGSSPRMRGTVRASRRQSRTGRFIPAHAGNSAAPHGVHAAHSVHPRACGEQGSSSSTSSHGSGSSPRMRGTDRRYGVRRRFRRFIPAHAGNRA